MARGTLKKKATDTYRTAKKAVRTVPAVLFGSEIQMVFDGAGAESGNMEPLILRHGEERKLPDSTLQRPGYVFAGWSTTAARANLLTDTSAPKTLYPKRTSASAGHWRASGGDGTRRLTDLDEPPAKGIRKGILLSGNANTAVAQDLVHLKSGMTYTVSCYIKGTGSLKILVGNSKTRRFRTDTAKAEGDGWTRMSFTFLADPAILVKGTASVYFSLAARGSELLLCGMKLEDGADVTGYRPGDNAEHRLRNKASTKGLIPGPDGIVTLHAVWKLQTYTVHFNSNGATGGLMDKQAIPAGRGYELVNNQFERTGYVFAGWNTKRNGSGDHYPNRAVVTDLTHGSSVTLYAQWEPCVYLIRFSGNGADTGTMPKQLLHVDETKPLDPNAFGRTGMVFAGWNTQKDGTGTAYADGQEVCNLKMGDVSAKKLLTVKPSKTDKPVLCAQGSCVAKNPADGKLYVLVCFIRNSSSYLMGNHADYTSSVVLYDIEEGKVDCSAEGLVLDHANGVCYHPDRERFYIATIGTCGERSGVAELDWNLRETAHHPVEGAEHIANIAYADGRFYGQTITKKSFRFTVLDNDLKLLDMDAVMPQYGGGTVGQGVATDGQFLYGVAVNFADPQWKHHQELTVYDLDGNYLGKERFTAITDEVEDLTVRGNQFYISTNRKAKADLYAGSPAQITLYAQWRPAETGEGGTP